MDLTGKPLSAVTADDVRTFVAGQPPEGDTLELKETLPATSRGEADPWVRGEAIVGDRARNEILAEMIAFANAHGGMLLLGVSETEDRPKRAKDVAPVRACAELAERLRLQARDCVDPQLPVVEIEDVSIDGDAGVVVIRVPQSRRAPHRLRQTLECYVRRADRTEKMTMREIQDLTLSRAAGFAGVEKRFEERSAGFRREASVRGKKQGVIGVYAVRATAIPVAADLSLDEVYQNPDVRPQFLRPAARVGYVQVHLSLPVHVAAEQPILRGTRFVDDRPRVTVRAEVHADGLVEYAVFGMVTGDVDDALIAEWVMSAAMNALLTADAFRIAAGAPGAEYGLEVELASEHHLILAQWNPRHRVEPAGHIAENPLLLPRLRLGPRADIAALMRVVHRDVFNAAGVDVRERELEVEVPELSS